MVRPVRVVYFLVLPSLGGYQLQPSAVRSGVVAFPLESVCYLIG